MSKVSGTYPSLSRGVNQQPFEARLDGQHGEQVNLWSDPVHGLSRRRGTTLQYCYADNVFGPSYHQLPADQKAELRDFYASYQTIPYVTGGLELQVHYPTKPQPVWMRDIFAGADGGIRVTRKIQGSSQTSPGADVEVVSMGKVGDAQWNATRAFMFKGIAAACQVGRFMLFYPQETTFTMGAEVNTWAGDANSHWALEIKNGIPNRKYTVEYLLGGARHSYSYTTPSSSYSGTLSTADIPFSDPEYQKKVNDRVNAYNAAVTAWITTAAAQTRPQYIVDQLLAAGLQSQLVAAGCNVYGGSSASVTNTIVVECLNGAVADPVAFDSGDGSSVLVTGSQVSSLSALTGVHKYGKIVKIKPDRGEQAFYMRAVPVNTSGLTPVWGKCRWEECPGTITPPVANPMLVMAV